MSPASDHSAWPTAESGTSPRISAAPTVRLQLQLIDRHWHVEVERGGLRVQLDGLKAVSSYLEQLALETPSTPVRGLR